MKLAFIGLGNMGGPMAVNLLRAGHGVRAFDLAPVALETARSAGAVVCSSAAEAVESADTVISMLPASRHVESLYMGEDGLL
ncbi:MAG TPA: NAD(P)-binding domain-containing protein, partial [Steroidobacteraceae bacterium]|nr:NAD(P)-binding domain-containing protein [Steroidobacteraceae bacterium]